MGVDLVVTITVSYPTKPHSTLSITNIICLTFPQNTPLHLCAQAGHVAPVSLLLNNGADLRMQNVYGMCPLDVTIEHKQEGVAKAILSCKK